MRIRGRLFPLLLAMTVLPNTATAACLLDDYSVRGEYERSAAVLTGQVISERPVAESRSYYDGVVYTVNVQAVYQGDIHGLVDIFSENSSGRFPMPPHGHYVLFVSRTGDRLMVDNCGNSGLLSEKTEVLRALKGFARPPRGGQNPNSALHADAAFGRAGERER